LVLATRLLTLAQRLRDALSALLLTIVYLVLAPVALALGVLTRAPALRAFLRPRDPSGRLVAPDVPEPDDDDLGWPS
jgi:hypothetical protein